MVEMNPSVNSVLSKPDELAFKVGHVEGMLWPSLARYARTASAAYGRIGGGTS